MIGQPATPPKSYITNPEQRSGLLVAVITGGRPNLIERQTSGLLPHLKTFGMHNIVWVVSDKDADGYERDDHELAVYTREWAYEYAREHWMLAEPPEPGGFFGAFPGREWACLEAERRGCWGVLQLDDNIMKLCMPRGTKASYRIAERNGGLALYADLLCAVALSTNSHMTGANLNSVANDAGVVARAGFPYSLFIERVGEGREHWNGPYEDDITHAFQYGTRADGATAAVLPSIRYLKESKSKTGMRSKYNHMRSVQLQRIFPESAKLMIKKQRSNGRGGPRIFHQMQNNAVRNRLTVLDPDLWGAAKARIEQLIEEWHPLQIEMTREKIAKRTAAAGISVADRKDST